MGDICMYEPDSGFFRRYHLALNFIYLCVLSLLWLMCCIPIVTLGPATMATYHTVVKVIRCGRGRLLTEWIRAFRDNWKNGVILGCGSALLAALLIAGSVVSALSASENRLWSVLFGVYSLLLILLGAVSTLLFPFFSRFHISILAGLKLGLVLSLRHLFTVFTCLLIWILEATILRYLPALILVIPAVGFLICSLVLEPILRKAANFSSRDSWRLE